MNPTFTRDMPTKQIPWLQISDFTTVRFIFLDKIRLVRYEKFCTKYAYCSKRLHTLVNSIPHYADFSKMICTPENFLPHYLNRLVRFCHSSKNRTSQGNTHCTLRGLAKFANLYYREATTLILVAYPK